MCGIVGYVGNNKVLPKLIQGLNKLEYRGYDSAGVAYIDINNKISICKTVGRVNVLEEKINFDAGGNIGIGHTRWATHGGVTVNNSHPHKSGNITIVHNGILENYLELKDFLISKGYVFSSDTDTEVACCYIDYVYNKRQKDIIEVLYECMTVFVGSYAIVGMNKEIPDSLFVMKKDSPLIVAYGNDGNYIASDILAYANETFKYFPLEDNMIGIITDSSIKIYKDKKLIEPDFKNIDIVEQDSKLGKFDHYMLKEMYEQKNLVNKWYDYYFKDNKIMDMIDVSKFSKIHIVGCGTAYHAGMIGKYLFEYYGDIEVHVFIASEYRYQKLFVDDNTLVIFISQSGETADTLACIKKVKDFNVTTLGIVNVENSSIARLVDSVIYTKALSEVAVASTKAYTAQVYVLVMLSLKIYLTKNKVKLEEIEKYYYNLGSLINKALDYDYSPITSLIWNKEHLFYLGRNIDYVTMMEGALKLKEISYIHCEAMAAGELKHGSISLINDEACVVVMSTIDNLAPKTISNIKEVKSRGAKVILFIREDLVGSLDKNSYDELVCIPKSSYELQPIVNVIYLQRLAYDVAKRLGRDIDKPRNLAKSVTVE